jgi:C_GCAxxG_C_C family probable redox protein
MNKTKVAVARFQDGFNCSQAVFSPYAEAMGLDKDTALKIAGTFGGGMGRTGQTCGAVTGALMALGLKYGATDAADKETKEQAYARVQEFAQRFATRNGDDLSCKALLGCDISTPDGQKMAQELGLYKNVCPKLVKDAAEIVEELLADRGE